MREPKLPVSVLDPFRRKEAHDPLYPNKSFLISLQREKEHCHFARVCMTTTLAKLEKQLDKQNHGALQRLLAPSVGRRSTACVCVWTAFRYYNTPSNVKTIDVYKCLYKQKHKQTGLFPSGFSPYKGHN